MDIDPVKPLGGKQTLEKSDSNKEEIQRTKQLFSDILSIIPIDSEEKAAKYRAALEKAYKKKL